MTTHTADSVAALLEERFPGISLGDDRDGLTPRFAPASVSSYLCEVAGPSASVGAICNYVWAMAFTPEAAGARHALRNLAGLITPEDAAATSG